MAAEEVCFDWPFAAAAAVAVVDCVDAGDGLGGVRKGCELAAGSGIVAQASLFQSLEASS